MYLVGYGLDVCPPLQEDLDGLEAALPGSTVECGEPTLAETKLSEDAWSPKRRHAIPTYNHKHSSTSMYRRTDVRLYINYVATIN